MTGRHSDFYTLRCQPKLNVRMDLVLSHGGRLGFSQEERGLISERTKAALAETKRRGELLGSNGRNLAVTNRRAVDVFASQLRAKLDADLMGRSYREIARHLNEAGITTVTGRKFYPQTVKNYLTRTSGFASGVILDP